MTYSETTLKAVSPEPVTNAEGNIPDQTESSRAEVTAKNPVKIMYGFRPFLLMTRGAMMKVAACNPRATIHNWVGGSLEMFPNTPIPEYARVWIRSTNPKNRKPMERTRK